MKKERHPIDEFFREELNGYQISPSKGAKESFLKDTQGFLKRSPSRWWWLMALSLVVLLMSAGAFLLFSRIHEPGKTGKPISSPNENNQISSNTKQTTETREKNAPETYSLSETEQSAPIHNARRDSREHIIKSEIVNDNTVSTERGPIMKEENPELNQVIPVASPVSSIIGEETRSGPPVDPASSGKDVQTADTIISPSQNAALPDTSQLPLPISPKQTGNSEWRLGAGVSFSPEWMFGTIEEPTFVNNFGVEGTFRFGRYSLRTGAGISLSKGTNQLTVEYNDYLGSYMKLDSMTFAWDESHYYIVPTYYLTNKDVYDSLMKLDDSKIVKRYTYLQIPIVFGYDFIIKEKMSFGLRAGPIMSILLKEKTLSDPYDPGKKKIISINEITPEQVSLNWQIMVGLNATFRFSRRVGIEVEPFAKYYFNSVHETTSGTGKPWSVGLRAAFFISFEK